MSLPPRLPSYLRNRVHHAQMVTGAQSQVVNSGGPITSVMPDEPQRVVPECFTVEIPGPLTAEQSEAITRLVRQYRSDVRILESELNGERAVNAVLRAKLRTIDEHTPLCGETMWDDVDKVTLVCRREAGHAHPSRQRVDPGYLNHSPDREPTTGSRVWLSPRQ